MRNIERYRKFFNTLIDCQIDAEELGKYLNHHELSVLATEAKVLSAQISRVAVRRQIQIEGAQNVSAD